MTAAHQLGESKSACIAGVTRNSVHDPAGGTETRLAETIRPASPLAYAERTRHSTTGDRRVVRCNSREDRL